MDLTSTETSDGLLKKRERGGSGNSELLVQVLQPAKPGKTAATRTGDIKVVGNQPVQSSLGTLHLAPSAVVGKTMYTEPAAENN